MAKTKITIYKYRCERCEHEWIPRESKTEPRVCPKCKSPYWNKAATVCKGGLMTTADERLALIRAKVERAKKHIGDLEREIRALL